MPVDRYGSPTSACSAPGSSATRRLQRRSRRRPDGRWRGGDAVIGTRHREAATGPRGLAYSAVRSVAPPPRASGTVVLVVAAPPVASLVATEWRSVEPLVHAPEAVKPAGVRRVGVGHDAILERERTHAGPFVPVGLPVRTNDAGCEFVEP